MGDVERYVKYRLNFIISITYNKKISRGGHKQNFTESVAQ